MDIISGWINGTKPLYETWLVYLKENNIDFDKITDDKRNKFLAKHVIPLSKFLGRYYK